MGLAAIEETQKFTYGDYLKWDDGERWEIIDGEAYNMTPAPKRMHQKILGNLYFHLRTLLTGKPCEAYLPPFDVRLPLGDEREEDITNVVQPDLSVICDPDKLDDNGCTGAPDFVIEIISPGSLKRDKLEKFNLYEMAGVKEYWLVWPEGQMVEVFLLGPDGSYGRPTIYTETDTAEISVLKNISIDLGKVFEAKEEEPKVGPPGPGYPGKTSRKQV
ncbi:MAG: Uma2 family endonuclease [bacterium]|nr:Uma2 family endonuclease [bacterium]